MRQRRRILRLGLHRLIRGSLVALALLLPGGAGASFFLVGEQLRGLDVRARVSLPGGGEDQEQRSSTPDPTDPGRFAERLEAHAGLPEAGSAESLGDHESELQVDAAGAARVESCGSGEVSSAASLAAGALAEASAESFYELVFQVEEQPEPFDLVLRLRSDRLSEVAPTSHQPRAFVRLEASDVGLDIVAAELVDPSEPGFGVETRRRFQGRLAPGRYRLEAAVESGARAQAGESARGVAVYEVSFALPEPAPAGAVAASFLALALLAARAQSRSRARRVRSSCSR